MIPAASALAPDEEADRDCHGDGLTLALQFAASALTGDAPAAHDESSAQGEQTTPNRSATILERSLHGHLGEAFRVVARSSASRTAIVTSQRDVTYGELLRAAELVRDRLLADARFRRGDRVMVWLPNGPEYIAAFYGTLLAGGAVVPTPPDVEPGRFRAIRAAAGARIVLTAEPVLRRRRAALSDEPEPLPLDATAEVDRDGPPDLPGGDAVAAVFFTSGSTGEPKGVTLSHANLLANAQSIIAYLEIAEDDRALGLLPFYHAYGNSVLQTHLLRGAAIVLGGSLLFPETILDAIRESRVTSLSGVPDVYRTLLSRSSLGERTLPTLRTVTIAGGRLDADQTQVLAFRVAPARVFVMYGQTEATARLSYLPPERLEERYGSIGRGIPGVELQVTGDDGRPVPPGETGEILARGANIMLGYWNDPAGTAAVLHHGWLKTGDLATVDADGFIYPQGRRSGLVKISGYRVHPAELEEFIRRDAGVLEAVAVPYETPGNGTRLALFVQAWAEAPAPTAAVLRSRCVDGLPRHLVPEYVEVLARFPLNDAYKIDRPALQRRAEAGEATPTDAGARTKQGQPPRSIEGR